MLQAAYLLFSSGIVSEGAGLEELESPCLRESFLVKVAGADEVVTASEHGLGSCLRAP